MNDVNGAVAGCPLRPEITPVAPAPPPDPVRIRAHMFFDGTQNNMYNSEAGAVDVPWYAVGRAIHRATFGEGSYANDFSNIARLYRSRPEDQALEFSVYVEGMGTARGAVDDYSGGVAFGMGSTGVWQRAIQARDRLAEEIQARCPDRDAPLSVEITSWGFSRGAATARHFVWRVLMGEDGDTLEQRLTAAGYTVQAVQFLFGGLFDTVASFGRNHDDDVAELHLRAIARAAQVVHLAAADEFRKNFRLTDIQSCGARGREVFLPGAHSDIGGGYVDRVREAVTVFQLPFDPDGASAEAAAYAEFPDAMPASLQPRINEEQRARDARVQADRDWLVTHGWCTRTEAAITGSRIRVTRAGIRNTYSFIPLRLMAEFGRDAGVAFVPELETRHRPDAALEALRTDRGQSVEAALRAHARGGRSAVDQWETPESWLTQLRHNWFHLSAEYDTSFSANVPQYFHDGRRWGESFQHVMHGRRMRRIMHG